MKDSTERPLFADLRAELGAMSGELRELVAARWELAQLELASDVRSGIWLAVVWLFAGIIIFVSLPLFAVCAAGALEGCCGLSDEVWLLIIAVGLLAFALLGSYLAWRRFRRRFIGLQETLEELREDMLWLQEMKGEE